VGAYDRGVADSNLAPEAQARVLIDERLRAAGWHVCDRSQIDLVNHVGVAVREVPMADGHGVVDLIARDKANLDIIWLKDDSIEDAADLPAPDVIADQIVDELQAALLEIAAIAADLDELLDNA
jgi:hypothetical protein